MLNSQGSLNRMEMSVYEVYFRHLKATSTPLSGIIHFDTLPQTCFDRIKQRNRPGEASIPLDYLESLERCTNTWLTTTAVPVLRLDQEIAQQEGGTHADQVQKVNLFVDNIWKK